MGKGENTGYQHVLLYPQCFISLLFRVVKTQKYCLGSRPPSQLNSLPLIKILDWSKLKAFADDKRMLTDDLNFVLGWVENIVGKKKILVTSIFFCFLHGVQKPSFSRLLKIRIVW